MSRGGVLEISPVRPEEHGSVGRIVVESYEALGLVLHPEYAAELLDVAGRATDPSVVVLIARLDGRPVGHAAVVVGPSPMSDHNEPEESSLRMVAVLPEAQGHGIGRALVVEAMEVSRHAGRPRMQLYTQSHMKAAQHIYESLGFHRAPQRDRYIERHETTLIAYEAVLF